MYGLALCLPHIPSGTSRTLGRNAYPSIRENRHQDGIQTDQDNYDLKADPTICFLGYMVFLLQVRQSCQILT